MFGFYGTSKITIKTGLSVSVVPLLLLSGCFNGSNGSGADLSWSSPDCDRVTGSPLVTFSSDRGENLVPMEAAPEPDGPSAPARLLHFSQIDGAMVSNSPDGLMQVSHDAGCTWEPTEAGVDFPQPLPDGLGVPVANGGHVFAIEQHGPPVGPVHHDVYRLSPSGEREDVFSVEGWPMFLVTTESEPETVYLLEMRPNQSDRYLILRGGEHGAYWTEESAIPDQFPSFFDINRYDPMHFVAGGNGRLANSYDGGVSWQEGDEFGHEDADSSYIRSVNFGGTAVGGEIWLAVVDWFDDAGQAEVAFYHSNDNGQHLSEVYRTPIDEPRQIPSVRKSMTTRPGTTGELYFTLQKCAMYRYRVEDDSLKEYTWDERENIGVSGIMAHPTDPDVIYVANGYQPECE